MKTFTLVLMVCSLFFVSSNVIFGAADKSKLEDAYFSACYDVLRNDLDDQEKSFESTKPIPEGYTRALEEYAHIPTSPGGADNYLEFASRSIDHALVVIINARHTFTVMDVDPSSPYRYLAGFAQTPCNLERANNTLKKKYAEHGIPPAAQKPFIYFKEISDTGTWTKINLHESEAEYKARRGLEDPKKSHNRCCELQ